MTLSCCLIYCKEDEDDWNRALALMAQTLTGLQRITICMCQRAVGWHIAPEYTAAGDLFLKEIYGLRRLGLRKAVVLVTDRAVGAHREGPPSSSEGARAPGEVGWTEEAWHQPGIYLV